MAWVLTPLRFPLAGIVLGVIHEETRCGLGDLSKSIDMWLHISPHLLLFAFLPALVFGDSMGLNYHVVKKMIWQCLLLASVGVIFTVVLLGVVAKYVFPYNWGWDLSLAFGAILAATDPVAVVAILNELGASQRLTMLISGEALFNDGTAIVVFNIFFFNRFYLLIS